MHRLTLLPYKSNGNSPYSIVLNAFHSYAPQHLHVTLGTSDNTMVLKIECVLHMCILYSNCCYTSIELF